MKKLSLIVALAVVLTVGGVFAAWVYNDGEIQSQTLSSNIAIDTASQSGSAATLTVNTDNVVLGVTNTTEGVNGKFGTKWTDASQNNDTVTITLKPADLASNTVKNQGLALKITLTESFGEVLDTDVLTINTSVIEVAVSTSQAENKLTKQDDGSFTYSFDLLNYMTLSNINLDTHSKYNDLYEVLAGTNKGSISIKVEVTGDTTV